MTVRMFSICHYVRNKKNLRNLVALLLLAGSGPAGSGAASAQELKRSGFLGVAAVPLPDAAKAQFPADETGVMVKGLVDGGSAKEADIRPGDIVTRVNDYKVTDVEGFVRNAKSLRAGDAAAISLRRGGDSMIKRVQVKPRPYETASDAAVLYKAVSADDSLRRVIVTTPDQKGPYPAILYITGVGCASQESLDLSSAESKLLYGLTRAGFVTMRVEKTGTGDSQGISCGAPQADLQAEVRGYLAGLRALKQYPFVDPENVFLLGLSLGGVEAPLIAGQEPVKGLVVVNTVAKPFFEYLLDTMRRQALLRHTAYDELERMMRLKELCNHRLLIEKRTPEQVLLDAPECREHIDYPAPYTLMQQWASLNMAEEWKRINSPVLIIYGTSDYVASNSDHPYLADIIDSFHPGSATLAPIEGMDHYLLTAASMEESIARTGRREFNPVVTAKITAWLKQQSAPAAAGAP